MNPEVSPWTVVQDKQRLSDLKRVEEERYYKDILKHQYQK